MLKPLSSRFDIRYNAKSLDNATQESYEKFREETMDAVHSIAERLRPLDNTYIDWDNAPGTITTRDGLVTFDEKTQAIRTFSAKVGSQQVGFSQEDTWLGLGPVKDHLQVKTRIGGFQKTWRQLDYTAKNDSVLLQRSTGYPDNVSDPYVDLQSVDPEKFIIAKKNSSINNYR